MNQDQLLGMLKVVLAMSLPIAVNRGWVPAGAVTDISSAIIGLGMAGWSWYAHTDSNKLIAAAAVPDVKKIITAINPVSDAVKQLAADTDHPKITDMATPLK